MLSRTRQIARNAVLTARTITDHLGDDPVLLGLQTAQRLPNRIVDPVLASLGRVFGADTSAIGAGAAVAQGRQADAEGRLRRALEAGVTGERARRLADVATAAGQTDLARRLLSGLAATDAVACATARLAWQCGHMSRAVDVLEQGPRAGGAQVLRLRDRYASELRTFTGSAPRIAPVPGYSPLPHRILHFATNSLPHTGSGYAQRTHSILVALAADGWDVAAMTRLGYPVQVGKPWAAPRDVVDGIVYHRSLPASLAEGFDARLQQQAEELARLVERFRPAVLHTTTHFVNGVVVRAVAEAYGIGWVYEARGQLADTWASTRGAEAVDSERYRLFKERERDVARAAGAVVTLGSAMRDELVAQGVEPSKIVICPNAVGEAFLEEPRSRARARAALGLADGVDYIGTVSSIVGYEGLDDLISAFAEIARGREDVVLLIAGDGVSLPSLKLQADRLGIRDKVLFPGRVARAQADVYHQALDVFVVPRKNLEVTRRVTPLKLVEASASSRAVVASDLPALAELVDDGVTGLLAAPEDPRDLASKIGALLDDPERCARLGRNGRAWALADRTWAANSAKYSAIYNGLGAERTNLP